MRDQIRYKDKEFGIEELRNAMHGLVTECREILMRELMRVSEREEEKGELPKIL